MQCYTELTPPTAVTHSLSLPFLSGSSNNLVLAKSSLLQIYSLKTVISEAGTGSLDQSNEGSQRIHTTKVILVAEYEISGTITSLGAVKILKSKSGGQALLVALRDAKLSLIEWDPERYSISTISVHYYEREDLRGSPWEPDISQCVNYLTVDPRSRCAALKFGLRHLAIIPFHQAGDDLVMNDYDPDMDSDKLQFKKSSLKDMNGDGSLANTPYATSFVLSLLALDPALNYPLHLAFLYEYREPTFGILSSRVAISSALLHERRDTVSYTVFTLDLEQKASTTLLLVNHLPYDLYAVVPLPLPIGGALLMGGNQLIHVDQAGKTNGVAVNEFAKRCTAFALSDQSDLRMRLESCVVEQLGANNGEMVLVLNTGELAILTFKTDGRSVSGISVRRVPPANCGAVNIGAASCASNVGRGRMFIGSEESDSVVLGWTRKTERLKRRRSEVDMAMIGEADVSEIDDDDGDDDDDLYTNSKPDDTLLKQALSSSIDSSEEYTFRVHDSLQNLAPMTALTLQAAIFTQTASVAQVESPAPAAYTKALLVNSGRGKTGGLMILKPSIDLIQTEQPTIANAHSIWTVQSANLEKNEYDRFVIASQLSQSGEEISTVYSVQLAEVIDTDFDPSAGATIDVGILNGGLRIVQVLKGEVRTYDGDFGLAQIFPMTDETTGAEPKVNSASFTDTYVLLVRDDFRVMILRAEEGGDLDELERGDALSTTHWLSGSLYEDSNDVFRLEWDEDDADDEEGGNVLMFLLSDTGGLQIYRLPNLRKPVYEADGLSYLPPFLSSDFSVRRTAVRDTLSEILIAELGDSVNKSPYLIARSVYNDLTIYQPYQAPIQGSSETALRFIKIPNPYIPEVESDDNQDNFIEQAYRPLRILQDLDGYSTVLLPGSSPCLILKSASSPPKVLRLGDSPIKSASGFHTPYCDRGLLYVDNEGNVRSATLPQSNQYGIGWSTRKITLGEDISAFDFHERAGFYVVGTSRKIEFKLPDDDLHSEWSTEDTTFLPRSDQGSIKLSDPRDWSTIDVYDLEPAEVVTCIKTISLEISEHTHIRETLVAVGTSLLRSEDLPALGRIYIFDIIKVVPDPDIPNSDHKLKLVAKEEVKGAVTSLSEIGTQGFLLAAQGQKCMVRGLKEDGTLLPVAFMDMQIHTNVVKELRGTGLCVMGDAIKGVWLAGYTEDPYQLRLFSKSQNHIEVLATDFLPDGKQLYIVAADADCNLHVLQFDPEHPRSLSGQRLLHHPTFHLASPISTLTLLPAPTPRILLTSASGSLALLSPLSPPHHRVLSALSSYLQTALAHPLGLNPRAFRTPSATIGGAVVEGVGGGRFAARGGVVDGGVVKRWMELGSWKRGEGRGRVGEEEGGVRGVLKSVLGGEIF